MSNVKLAVSTRNKMAQGILDDLDAGTGPAYFEFYTGTQPAGPAVAVGTQVKLGTVVCSDPCGTLIDGVLVFDDIAQDAGADATGDATWARGYSSDGVARIDLDVTDEAGDGNIKLNTIHIVAGGPIELASMTITIGGA